MRQPAATWTVGAVILGLGSLVGPTQAQSDFHLFPFDLALSERLQGYLGQPDPKGILDALVALDMTRFERRAEETDQRYARPTLLAFYVQLVTANPELAVDYVRNIVEKKDADTASFGAEVIGYSDTASRSEAMRLLIEGFSLPEEQADVLRGMTPFPYKSLSPTVAGELDMLWACFFATGDQDFLTRLAEPLIDHPVDREEALRQLRLLASTKPQPGSTKHTEAYRLALGEAARQGLVVNARRMSTVRRFLSELADDSASPLAELAKAILSEASVG